MLCSALRPLALDWSRSRGAECLHLCQVSWRRRAPCNKCHSGMSAANMRHSRSDASSAATVAASSDTAVMRGWVAEGSDDDDDNEDEDDGPTANLLSWWRLTKELRAPRKGVQWWPVLFLLTLACILARFTVRCQLALCSDRPVYIMLEPSSP